LTSDFLDWAVIFVKKPFLEVRKLSANYSEEGHQFVVLKDISFSVSKGEFVCIVGPSGCGKSTLLRMIAGLEKPSGGAVFFEGQPIVAENPRVAMVFQNFALLPWLTVLQNVSLGLEAAGMAKDAQKKIALRYVDIVGLSGFENAYPRELSGGMKQRVGLARALAVHPGLLCMDEPFSALDPLTAENLRQEVLNLWKDRILPPDSVVMVTHSIEEAIYMADRIFVMSKPPAKIVATLKVTLPRPRNRKSEEFYHFVDKVYSLIT